MVVMVVVVGRVSAVSQVSPQGRGRAAGVAGCPRHTPAVRRARPSTVWAPTSSCLPHLES